MAPGGKVGSAGRKRNGKRTVRRWRLAAREVRQAVWNQVLSNDTRGVLGSFGCRVGSRGGFLHSFG
ncbi:hypothetical protein DEO72_LG8g2793 [Vigna unguiculata]|uniref:Uncharacterized protein n=1 Tax=Vigna unguiculata TaxID=3917 RepID=A0A4D6MTJ9_VIGUN|nr:hypothetical protein DEO72_LG8g2792 [Vigna unguiculata]QCE04754.1 hypothetical protein DEO72_LG8g2793 [Vigna unguiculata]